MHAKIKARYKFLIIIIIITVIIIIIIIIIIRVSVKGIGLYSRTQLSVHPRLLNTNTSLSSSVFFVPGESF